MQGQLLNARVGNQLHPQSANVAGGMTYRPPIEASVSFIQEDICPMPTKKGAECRAYPTTTGFCMGHSNAVAHALEELLGG